MFKKKKYAELAMYGFAPAKEAYRPLAYELITIEKNDDGDPMDVIRNLKNTAAFMAMRNPEIEEIYVMDNNKYLKRNLDMAFKRGDLESFVLFKVYVTSKGIKLY